MWGRLSLCLMLCLASAGCASLVVHKVSEEQRTAGKDHVHGFRYYLSRPYVIVKAPILVSESSTLYVVEERPTPVGAAHLLPPLGVETVSRINPASGSFESVSEAELAALRKLLPSEPQPEVQLVRHQQAAPPAVVQQPTQVGLQGLLATDAAAGAAGNIPSAAVIQATDQSAGSASGAAGTNGAHALTIPPVTQDPTPPKRPTVTLTGNIQIVFLPDLEEQYAIHNCNFLSKSAYTLNFQDGWQLTDVSGEFDSTAVPLEILNFIDKAISAAKTVAIAGIDQQARLLGAADVGKAPALASGGTVYQVITSTYLRPGVYRLNKPWECSKDHPASGCGLLAMMGLATFETMRVELNPTLRTLSDIKQECLKQ